MVIPLNGFEDYINKVILERGLSYFQKGRVAEPIEIDNGFFEFDVRGSSNYIVRLTLKDNVVVDYVCDCPYDRGSVCKHVVAAIFYLQKDVLGLGTKQKKEKKERKNIAVNPNDPKNLSEQVNLILKKLSEDDLKQFVSKTAQEHISFREIFLTSFAHLNDDYSKEYYVKQIKTILKKSMDKGGFIYSANTHSVTRSVSELLNAARIFLEKKRFKSCINVCTAVMEEMVQALQFADDSYGNVSGSVSEALSILEEIISDDIEEEIRLLLLNYFVWAYLNNVFDDWDWHTEIVVLASMLVRNEEEGERIISFAREEEKDGYRENFTKDITLMVYKNTKSDEEINKFLDENVSNPDFRRQIIDKAIEDRDFEKAIKLAKEGLKLVKRNSIYDSDLWNSMLFRIADLQNDKMKMIEYARILFLEQFTPDKDYYGILKNIVEIDKWNEFVEGLITDLKKRKKYDEVKSVYIKEQLWDRLFEDVNKNPSLDEVQYYEKYLKQNYKEEIIGFYEDGIYEYLKHNTDRSHYREACRYLRRMLKLGAREKVNLMIEILKKDYYRRPALIDELNKV